jgi:type VI secretion system secreted protein VgrG
LITQANRPLRVNTKLGPDVLLLESFRGTETISKPFSFTLKLLSDNPAVNLKDLLSSPMVITVELPEEKERHIHGIVNRAVQLEFGEDGLVGYEVEIVGWIWFLSLFTDCRIFQNKTAPEIIEQVFGDRGFTDFKLQLQGSYPKREYCVQYRETDLNFVSRLMEDEGIFYFFQHDEDKHTLVMADAQSSIVDCPNLATARYMPATGAVQEDDTITTLLHEQKVYAGMSSLNDYDFEKPNTSLNATTSSDQKGEIYDYPGKYKTKGEGDTYARIRLEEQEVKLSTVRGESFCRALQSGFKFTLQDHYRDDENQPYTIVRVEHQAQNTSYRSGSSDEFKYRNSFEAIPNTVVFRPPRLAVKPIVKGSQTAVVVGKSGEEIWTDNYGRVKVQFYWDRAGTKDENSSCWIRVSQTIAGKGWGAIHLPRITQEVIVDFLEGDPDRPIITGRVYNADQTVPYTLPDEQTKSTFKSMSSKGGGGFNEIRIEDKKGSEQIFMHAEKNRDTRVKNNEYKNIEKDLHLVVEQDHFEHMKNDHHITVDRDLMEKIGRDHHLNIIGKQAIKVGDSHTLQVTGAVTEVFSQSHSEDTKASIYLKAGATIVIEAAAGITLKCGSNSVVVDPTGVTVTGSLVTIAGSMTKINSGPGSPAGVGTPGTAVSPTDPKAAIDADDAQAGQLTQGSASPIPPARAGYGTISPVPHHPPPPSSDPPPKEKTWIEIKLEDVERKPVPGEAYKITMGDQTIAEGTLDDKGHARVDGIDPGSCKVTFPKLDKTVWKPK